MGATAARRLLGTATCPWLPTTLHPRRRPACGCSNPCRLAPHPTRGRSSRSTGPSRRPVLVRPPGSTCRVRPSAGRTACFSSGLTAFSFATPSAGPARSSTATPSRNNASKTATRSSLGDSASSTSRATCPARVPTHARDRPPSSPPARTAGFGRSRSTPTVKRCSSASGRAWTWHCRIPRCRRPTWPWFACLRSAATAGWRSTWAARVRPATASGSSRR